MKFDFTSKNLVFQTKFSANNLSIVVLFLLILSSTQRLLAQETFIDNFDTNSYNTNNGTRLFSSNWTENDLSGGGATSGRISISSGSLVFKNLDHNDRIDRTFNLAGATSATASIELNSGQRGSGSLGIQFYNVLNNHWEDVGEINYNETNGKLSFSLTPEFIGTNSGVRFYSKSGAWGFNDKITLNYFRLDTTIPTSTTNAQIKKEFRPRFSDNLNGDVTFIANTVIGTDAKDPYNLNGGNHSLNTVFVDIDDDNDTFNSSSADLANPDVSSCLRIRKAFMYWAASNKEYDEDKDTGNGGKEPKWSYNKVKLMLPGANSYIDITADETIYNGRPEEFENAPIVLIKDITTEVNALSDPFGTYQVANVKATEGKLRSYSNSNTGTSGGWQIVFIYESFDLPAKNITLFDGYAHVTQTKNSFDINFDGFQTVPTGDVKGKVLIGALEGDRDISGDQIQLLNTKDNWTKLSTGEREENNFFNSKITRNGGQLTNRKPASLNTLGFDAALFELDNPNNILIDNGQTSAKIRLTSNQESYGLYLLGLSIEVYEPSLGALGLSLANSTPHIVDPGQLVDFDIAMKNYGNDDVQNLTISCVLPPQLTFDNVSSLPPGITHTYDPSGLLLFSVPDGLTDINSPSYTISFKAKVKEQCPSCQADFSIQAIAEYTGAINKEIKYTASSGTLETCGFGNNDPTPLTINSSVVINDASAIEGDKMTFTITASHVYESDINFKLTYAPGTATESDYSGPTSITLPAGNNTVSFKVLAVNDDWVEATEQNFTVTISDPSGTANISDSVGSGTVTDTDIASITGEDFTVTEGGTIQYKFLLSTDTNADGDSYVGIEDAYSIDYTVQKKPNSTYPATDGLDFESFNGTATFKANSPAGTAIIIDIPTKEDILIEATEEFEIEKFRSSTETDKYGVPASRVGIDPEKNTLKIIDNDNIPGTTGITFQNDDITVNEADGTATINMLLTGNVQGGFSIDYATDNDSAVQPGDYTATGGTLAFAGTDGETQPITVTIIDDNIIEATERLFVNLSNLSTTLIPINDGQGNINITDNDNIPGTTGITFQNDDITVNEADGTATINVLLTGNVQGGFSIDYATDNDSAVQPGDYTATGGTLAFAGTDGETQPITVTIIDDNIIEATERLFVNLSNLSTTLIPINDGQGNINITDNDNIPGTTGITFQNDDITVNEADGTATINVLLTGNVQGGFSIDYATDNDSAVQPGDYTATGGTLAFAGTDGETQPITVTIIDDNIIEATERLFVNLSNLSTTLIPINDGQGNINITDNDNIPGTTGITFQNDDITVNEADGTATINVLLTGNVQGGFSIDYATDNDSAVQPGDYTATGGTLAFAGTDGETQPITVTIIDDNIIEATERLFVNLSNLSTTLIPINDGQGNINITDNDGDPSTLGVQFDVASIDVDEAAGTVSLDVVLNAQVQDEFTVEFYTVDGSTIEGSDYNGVPRNTSTLTFGGTSSNTQTIVIPIIDDILIENTEDFHVILENISTPLVGILTNDTAIVNIIDNDGNEEWPTDITIEACDTVPEASTISSDSTCPITVTFIESIEGQDDECATEYTITRTWTITDCVGNIRVHTQIITIEDTVAPTFDQSLPQNMTVACNMVPNAATLTAEDSCDTDIVVDFNEVTTNNANCVMGYTVTRTWKASDCAGNSVTHTQVITVEPTGAIVSGAYEEEITILCGDDIPEVPQMVFTGGCGNYNTVLDEQNQTASDSDDYMIIRTWNVTDSCGNTASFEQIIFVLQPQLQEITIELCIEQGAIDLRNYLPEDFDNIGTFMVMEGNAVLSGSMFDPINHLPGEYKIGYSSTKGTCKYYVDFTIVENTDCVPCGRDEIEISKAVTANGDGVNDYFEIKGVEFCTFSFDIMIFNRWGSKVADIKDYQNDWGGASPDGSFGQSGMLPTGTYYYIITATDKETGKIMEPFNGYIYLGTE
ncbi:Calx-beta domain-containing protein [Maribacter sp. X9]|uniref:Calx-beta domain-containing protein n=1 Tax=Maribacter sp. X9 TaxID=3402159 RepID=UPI003AF361C5